MDDSLDNARVRGLSQRFVSCWRKTGRLTVRNGEVWTPLREARERGELTDRMNPREVLMEVLDFLVVGGEVALPVGDAHWDRTLLPHVPRWIRLDGRETAEPDRTWQNRVWHDKLLPAVEGRKRLSPEQIRLLTNLDDLLRQEGPLAPCGIRSRSLRLTGDEKMLKKLLRTDVIGGLDSKILNVVEYPLPLCSVRIGPGHRLLIIENLEPFYAALEGLSPRPGTFGAVAYGKGNEVADSIRSVKLLLPGITEILYVGDLDKTGMSILRRAQVVAATVGLRVEPAQTIYRAMIPELLTYPQEIEC